MEDEKEVSYNQINNAVFSNLDFVGAGTLGLIAAGFPPAQAAVLAQDPAYNPLFHSKLFNLFQNLLTSLMLLKMEKVKMITLTTQLNFHMHSMML